MPDDMYKKDSVDELLSQEELDQAPKAVLFQGRVLLISILICLISCAIFSYYVEVPVTISSDGIIWTSMGVRHITSQTDGIIKDIMVDKHQYIHKGDVVAIIDQSELQIRLDSLKSELKSVDHYIDALIALEEKEKTTSDAYSEKINAIIDSSSKRYLEHEARIAKREELLKEYKRQGIIKQEVIDSLLNQLGNIRDQISRNVELREEQIRQSIDTDIKISKEILSQKREAEGIQQQIALLEKQIADKGEIRSTFNGQILQLDVDSGDYVSISRTVVTLQPENSENNLLALAYPSFADGSKLTLGMTVELELSAYPKKKYGVLYGEIASISRVPASTESMMRELKNDQLVRKLSGEGAPYELRIRLKTQTRSADACAIARTSC